MVAVLSSSKALETLSMTFLCSPGEFETTYSFTNFCSFRSTLIVLAAIFVEMTAGEEDLDLRTR